LTEEWRLALRSHRDSELGARQLLPDRTGIRESEIDGTNTFV
jgi:hypothetical protein